MNIFYLSENPTECARLHCDKHVVKMCTEYAQLLSTAHRVLDGNLYLAKTVNGRNIKRWRMNDATMDFNLYKASHVNHPSNIWVRNHSDHYKYTYNLWEELCREYTHRYGRQHKSWTQLGFLLRNPPENISEDEILVCQPPPAMKHYQQCIVPNDSIESYKNYYKVAKASFAKWTKRETPRFMT